MRLLFLFLSFTFVISRIELDYIPKLLVPPGYDMWLPDGDSIVYSYVVKNDTICQMRVHDNFVKYRLINTKEFIDVDNGLLRNKSKPIYFKDRHILWQPLVSQHGHIKTEPRLCFWYDNGPNFVIHTTGDDLQLITLNNGTGLRTNRFKKGRDLLAYDYQLDHIYAYDNGRIYRMTTRYFVNAAKSIDHTRDMYHTLTKWRYLKYRNCTDLMAVESRIFIICHRHMFEADDTGYSEIGYYNSDKFNHTLIPHYIEGDIMWNVVKLDNLNSEYETSTTLMYEKSVDVMPIEVVSFD